jgi:hypothetical protein
LREKEGEEEKGNAPEAPLPRLPFDVVNDLRRRAYLQNPPPQRNQPRTNPARPIPQPRSETHPLPHCLGPLLDAQREVVSPRSASIGRHCWGGLVGEVNAGGNVFVQLRIRTLRLIEEVDEVGVGTGSDGTDGVLVEG